MSTKLMLIGAGGHAKVVLDAALLSGVSDIELWDDDISLSGQSVMGFSIHAPICVTGQEGVVHIAVGGIAARKKLLYKFERLGYMPASILHPTASIAQASSVGVGSFVAAQAVLAPDTTLGKSVIVNHGAIVDHDCLVGDFSHIAPHVTLGGGVSIGEECMIGAGAVVLPGVKVARGVTVGAGAVVVSDVHQVGITVVGVPAK